MKELIYKLFKNNKFKHLCFHEIAYSVPRDKALEKEKRTRIRKVYCARCSKF